MCKKMRKELKQEKETKWGKKILHCKFSDKQQEHRAQQLRWVQIITTQQCYCIWEKMERTERFGGCARAATALPRGKRETLTPDVSE